jgi:uncharacterized protein (TIGR00255 family)
MTGYGQGCWEGEGRLVRVELRAVNSRYFKLITRMPNEFAAAERDFEKILRGRVDRGSIELFVKVELMGARAARPINKEALASYIRQLREVGDDLGVTIAFNADSLLNLPGVLDADEVSDEEAALLQTKVVEAIGSALDDLDRMRAAEGANLREELLRHCAGIESTVAEIDAKHPEAQARYKERLTERINRLLQGTDMVVTEQDIARECAIYAERSSVCEEVARLQSHIQQFREALGQAEPVGRRLEFLAQEMHREVNTMGSKVADVDLSRKVADLHGAVDKIREQVLNIE